MPSIFYVILLAPINDANILKPFTYVFQNKTDAARPAPIKQQRLNLSYIGFCCIRGMSSVFFGKNPCSMMIETKTFANHLPNDFGSNDNADLHFH